MQLFFIVIGNLIAKKKLFGSLIVNRNFNCFKKKPIAQGLSINSYLITKQEPQEHLKVLIKWAKEKESINLPSYSQAEQKVHQIKTLRVFLNFLYFYPKTTWK